jgi:hypothetical protein
LCGDALPWVVPQNEELELQYKTCYARILDSKRRFLEAATRYYELSQVGKRRIGSSEVRPTPQPVVSCPFCGRCAGRRSPWSMLCAV